jgi:two-component system NarL family sensor kinase
LTNIIKHSHATLAAITLDYGPQNIVLTIKDNGKGFVMSEQAGPQQGHFGLLGMTERTSRLRGKVSITSEPGRGTTVQTLIPLDAPPEPGLTESQLGAQL